MLTESGTTPPKKASPTVGSIHEIIGFGRLLFASAPVSAALAVLYLVLGSLSEGVSVLLLIPILHIAGNANNVVQLPASGWMGDLLPFDSLGLAALLAALVAAIVAQAGFQRLKSVHIAELMFDFVNRQRLGLFAAIGNAKWTAFTRERVSDLEYAVNGDIERVQGAAYYFLMLLQTAVLLTAYILVSLFISPAMTAAAAGLGLVVFLGLYPFRRRAARHGEQVTANRKNQYRTVSEFFAGLKLAKSLGVEARYFDRLRRDLDRIRVDNSSYVRIGTASQQIFKILNAVALSLFVYYALAMRGLSVAETVVLLLVFARVAPRFLDFQNNLQQMLVALPAYRSIAALRHRFDAERDPVQSSGRGANTMVLRQKIVFRDVSFSYGDRPGSAPTPSVDAASFEISAGEVTALIGASGSGKSTIADLAHGLITPDAGQISIDGRPLSPTNLHDWRMQVAVVPQDVVLINGSVADNLRLAQPDASDEAIWTALEAASAAEFVGKLPRGLDASVGERGVAFSGGERQRLALARALLLRPSLLILDEATSALDWENQALIAETIRGLRGRMAILTIAHRPSMISFADWVVALEAGTVVEAGRYDSLKSTPGSYLRRMLNSEQSAA